MNLWYKVLLKISNQISYYLTAISLKPRNSINIIENQKHRIPPQIELTRIIKKNNSFMPGKTITINTEATEIEVKVIYKTKMTFSHMSELAISGIDVYEKNKNDYYWKCTIYPQNEFSMCAKKKLNLDKGIHRLVFYLPPFAEVKKLFVSSKEEINIINNDKTEIVVYGSSISQGCAASRPALSYTNILSRKLNKNVLNYGFSEACRGEKTIVEYISALSAPIYVLEYDHNSSLPELKDNHYEMYKTIRKHNPDSLIIFLSRISGGISNSIEDNNERINIIESTYEKAIKANDKKVFFINGDKLYLENKDELLVDDRHPNDKGMFLIANEICRVIKNAEGDNNET